MSAKDIAVFGFSIAVVWDGFTSFAGLVSILGGWEADFLQMVFAAIGAIVIVVIGISTKPIFENDGLAFKILAWVWGGTLLFDAYTSFVGNAAFVVLRNEEINGFLDIIRNVNFSQIITTIFLTIVVSGAPIAISYLRGEDWDDPTHSPIPYTYSEPQLPPLNSSELKIPNLWQQSPQMPTDQTNMNVDWNEAEYQQLIQDLTKIRKY